MKVWKIKLVWIVLAIIVLIWWASIVFPISIDIKVKHNSGFQSLIK